MKIPTTEFCPTCAAETPEDILKRAGRIQNRLMQDLDSGKFECARGHVIDFGSIAETPEPPTAAIEAPERPAATQPARETSVAVEEMPQSHEAQILPGSMRRKQGGEIEMTLRIPEQFSEPLLEYCRGLGQEPEAYVNQVIGAAFENGWFL